jgi:CheY-like chemotaxis protein
MSLRPVDVLIADDEPHVRAVLRRLLEGEGYTCAEAEDGPQAVSLAQAAPPSCLLLDLRMPGLDGFAVARQLRADPGTRGIHIHCLTGLATDEARAEAGRAGCEQFLTKPVDFDRLLEVIRGATEPPPPEWITGLTFAEAEELLDWLERRGCTGLELSCEEGAGVAVRCTCPPGFRLTRGADGRIRFDRI